MVGYLEFDQNLTKTDILNLLDAFRTVNPSDTSHLEFETLPWQYGPMQGAQDVLYVNYPSDESVLAQLRDFSGISTSPVVKTILPHQVTVKVVDTASDAALAQGALHDLVQKAGFRSGGTGSVASAPAHTEVLYRAGQINQDDLLLQYLSPTTQLLESPSLKGADAEVVLGKDFTAITLRAEADR